MQPLMSAVPAGGAGQVPSGDQADAMTAAGPASAGTQLEELSQEECRLLLGLGAVGRIGFVVDGLPVVLPVNYRLVNDDAGLSVVLRTRPGSAIGRAPEHVAFEIDGIDLDNQLGWSVLVSGVLHNLDHNEIELLKKRFDPRPWPQQDRSSWLAITAHGISGRRLHAQREWDFPFEAHHHTDRARQVEAMLS